MKLHLDNGAGRRRCNDLRGSNLAATPEEVDCATCRRIGGLDDRPVGAPGSLPGAAAAEPEGAPAPLLPPAETVDPNNRAAWLAERRKSLGGSDVAAVLGLPGAYSGAYAVWLDKTGRHTEDDPEDQDLLGLGLLLEAALLRFAGATQPTRFLRHPERPWMAGTPDGFDEDGDGVECKVLVHGDANKRRLQWEMQCRWYMAITGRPRWRLVMLDLPAYLPAETVAALVRCSTAEEQLEAIHKIKRARFVEASFDRELDLEAEIVRRAGAWWQRHVIEDQPPPVDGDEITGRYLRERYQETGAEWTNRNDLGEAVRRYVQLGEDATRIKNEREHLRQTIQDATGDSAGIRGAWGTCKWSRWKRRTLDRTKLLAENPEAVELLEKYTESVPAGRLYPKLKE